MSADFRPTAAEAAPVARNAKKYWPSMDICGSPHEAWACSHLCRETVQTGGQGVRQLHPAPLQPGALAPFHRRPELFRVSGLITPQPPIQGGQLRAYEAGAVKSPPTPSRGKPTALGGGYPLRQRNAAESAHVATRGHKRSEEVRQVREITPLNPLSRGELKDCGPTRGA